MVPDTLLSHISEEASSKDSTNNTFVENPTMVSTSTGASGGLPIGASGGLPSENFSATGSSINATGAKISDATGSAPVGRLAYLRQSYTSRRDSLQRSDLMLASWRDITNSNYGSSFSKWASWCQQRGRDPLSQPIEDVVNFLASLSTNQDLVFMIQIIFAHCAIAEGTNEEQHLQRNKTACSFYKHYAFLCKPVL